jgi:hypothetical protein
MRGSGIGRCNGTIVVLKQRRHPAAKGAKIKICPLNTVHEPWIRRWWVLIHPSPSRRLRIICS